MKYVFGGSFLVLVLLSVVAWLWRPHETDTRIPLIWVSDDNPLRREQIALFNRLYPKYHLKLDPQNGGLEKVIVQSLAGVGPDLFDNYSGWQLDVYVRSGIALDCTNELARRGISTKDIWPCLTNLIVDRGRVYGYLDNASAPAIWYNKQLFDDAGVPYPKPNWTWDDFISIAKRLTKRDKYGRPLQLGFIGSWDWKSILAEWGGHIYSPAGTRCTLDSPQAIAALQFMKDLTFKYKIMPSLAEETTMARAGGWGADMITLFGSGRGAMAIGGRWWLAVLRQPSYAHLRLGVVPMPPGPTGRIVGNGRSTLINRFSKHREGALTFLEYMHSKAWNELVNEQADALAPVMKYDYTNTFLHNPKYPKEDYNEVWRSALERATPEQVSYFVNGATVDRILSDKTELIRLGGSVPKAMREATRLINKAIVDQLRRDPVLKKQYFEKLAHGAKPAWNRPEDAP